MDNEMESSDILTPTTSSNLTSSESSNNQSQTYLLMLNLISAQDLPQVSKSMRTYAIVWIHPKHKLTSSIDQKGHTNPTWNDQFSFCVNDEFLMSDHAAVTIEIYNTTSWFKDVLVGTVCVNVNDLITTSAVNSIRFVSLQIHRSSGKFHGKLNMGVALVDDSKKKSIPYFQMNHTTVDNLDMLNKYGDTFRENQHLDHDSIINGSIINGSNCNGSELCSDVGPSASIVAAEIARQSLQVPPEGVAGRAKPRQEKEVIDIAGSLVEEMTIEEATAKGLTSKVTRLKKEVPFPPNYEGSNKSKKVLARRQSEAGLFSCFANAYGFEFTIVCGSSSKHDSKENSNINRPEKKRTSIVRKAHSA